jgi:nicotinamide-nucleotide amidase
MDDGVLAEEAARVAGLLRQSGLKLAVAESCTGGWIAKVLTDIPGSSDWFERGFVTYSNEAKQEMLGVPASILRQSGAVSAETVSAMVAGALGHSHADLALAVSGIAGPGGGSVEKPVGTLWLAWGRRGADCHCVLQQFAGDREAVRRQAVRSALRGVTR